MNEPKYGRGFVVGPWRVDPSLNRLTAADREARLGSKAMAVLVHLVSRAGRLATKEGIVSDVWQGRVVSDEVLAVAICEIRKALGDRARSPRYIETIQGKGYRWLAPVTWREAGPTPGLPDACQQASASKEAVSPGARSAGDTDSTEGSCPERSSAPRKRDARTRIPDLSPRGRAMLLALFSILLALTAAGFWPQKEPAAPQSFDRLAVLPLADDSIDGPRDRVLADGLTGALIQGLARLQPVEIISRTSVARFLPPTSMSAPDIAEQLGADLLLEGAVSRTGDALRIDLRLIDAATDRYLWSGNYDASIGDLRALQWTIASNVAQAIQDVGNSPPNAPGKSVSPSWPVASLVPAAVDAYLAGRFALSQAIDVGETSDLQHAEASFERTIELEPAFAEGYVGLSLTYMLERWMDIGDRDRLDARARETAARALELDPLSGRAHMALGEAAMLCDRDLDAAEALFRQALRLDPGDGDTYVALGWMLRMQRRFDEAEAMARRARQLEPLALAPLRLLTSVLYESGRAQEALRWADRMNALSNGTGDRMRALSLLTLGRTDQARDAFLVLFGKRGATGEELANLGRAYGREGWDAIFRFALQQPATSPLGRAAAYMRLGEQEEALGILKRAAARDAPELLLAFAEPSLSPLHGEPRFRAILRQYGLLATAEDLS